MKGAASRLRTWAGIGTKSKFRDWAAETGIRAGRSDRQSVIAMNSLFVFCIFLRED